MKPKSKVGFLKHPQRGNSCLKQQMIHINQPSGIGMERLEESSQQFPNHVGSSPFLSPLKCCSTSGSSGLSGVSRGGGWLQVRRTCRLCPAPPPLCPFHPSGGAQPCSPLCTHLLCCFFPAAAHVSRSARAPGRGSEGAFPRFWAQTLLVLGVSLDLKAKEGGQWRKLEMIP